MDSNVVIVVFNFHGADTAKVSKRLRDGFKKEFDCPFTVKKYNMYMDGADLVDFCCAVNERNWKLPKYWQRTFFWVTR